MREVRRSSKRSARWGSASLIARWHLTLKGLALHLCSRRPAPLCTPPPWPEFPAHTREHPALCCARGSNLLANILSTAHLIAGSGSGGWGHVFPQMWVLSPSIHTYRDVSHRARQDTRAIHRIRRILAQTSRIHPRYICDIPQLRDTMRRPRIRPAIHVGYAMLQQTGYAV